jgi:hypothetical protein
MKARVSRMFLIACGILFLLGGMLLSAPGDSWPWHAITGACAVVAVGVGPLGYRIAGLLAAGVAVVLIIADLKAGVAHREKMSRRHAQVERGQAIDGEAEGSSGRYQAVSPKTGTGSE